MVHRLNCSAACGIFPDQGLNTCPLHWRHCTTKEVPKYIFFKINVLICSWIVYLKASIWGNELFLISCSCRKNFKSFLQRHWAYGWLAASDISRFHAGNITILSEFSQGLAECLFLKAFSQGLRMVFWQCILLSSVKVMFVRERWSCDGKPELTWETPGARVATQSHQGWFEAAACWVSGSPSAFQVSGVDSLYCECIL